MIDWTAASCPITQHFTVKDAIYLPTWKRLAIPADGLETQVEASLLVLLDKMEVVRTYLGVPIIVHVTYRPHLYNLLIGGAPNSAHVHGMAMDFDPDGITCHDGIQRILADGMLDKWGMRMEDNGPFPSWIHLDLFPVGPSGKRYFKP